MKRLGYNEPNKGERLPAAGWIRIRAKSSRNDPCPELEAPDPSSASNMLLHRLSWSGRV